MKVHSLIIIWLVIHKIQRMSLGFECAAIARQLHQLAVMKDLDTQ